MQSNQSTYSLLSVAGFCHTVKFGTVLIEGLKASWLNSLSSVRG